MRLFLLSRRRSSAWSHIWRRRRSFRFRLRFNGSHTRNPSATVFAPSDSAFKKSAHTVQSPTPHRRRQDPYHAPGQSLTLSTSSSDRLTSINNIKLIQSPIYADGSLLVYGIDRFFDPNFQFNSQRPISSVPIPLFCQEPHRKCLRFLQPSHSNPKTDGYGCVLMNAAFRCAHRLRWNVLVNERSALPIFLEWDSRSISHDLPAFWFLTEFRCSFRHVLQRYSRVTGQVQFLLLIMRKHVWSFWILSHFNFLIIAVEIYSCFACVMLNTF